MADSSFEEQVRKELEALRLQPDEMVWQNVEAELHTEKKRRWLVWLFALLVISGSAGLYYYIGHTTDNQQITVDKPSKQQTETNKETVVASGKEANTEQILPGKQQQQIQQDKPISSNVPVDFRVVVKKQSAQPNKRNTVTEISNKPVALRPDLPAKQQQQSLVMDRSDKKLADAITKDETAISQKEITDNNNNSKAVVEQASNEQKEATKEPVASTRSDSSQTVEQPLAPTAVITEKKQNKRPWQFFASVEAGTSGEIRSLRSAGNVLDFASASNIGNGSFFAPGNGLSSTGGVFYKTPSRSNGMSFGLQAQAIKSVGKKSSIGVSAGYAHYSAVIGVGRKVDSIIQQSDQNYYYISTDSIGYTNAYHFLTLGADYYRHFKLGSSATLRWRLGMGMGILLSSNSLHFDQSRGRLYRNSSLLTDLQWNISTGIDIGLGKKQAFFIGPQLTYFLSKTSQEPSSSRHLFGAAIRATFAIPKKKK